MSHINPLFAVEAEQHLLLGMTDEAIYLCHEGIEAFPDYPMGYVILVQAYILNGRKSEARSLIGQAASRFPDNKTLMMLVNKVTGEISSEGEAAEYKPQKESTIEEIIQESEEIISEKIEEKQAGDSFLDEEFVGIEEQEAIEADSAQIDKIPSKVFSSEFLSYQSNKAGAIQLRASDIGLIPGLFYQSPELLPQDNYLYPLPNYPSFPTFNNLINKQESIEIHEAVEADESYDELNQELEEIARRLEHARILPVIREETNEIFGEEDLAGPDIATETMAKIYEKQGAYELAAKTYKDLIARYSHKLRQFEDKISELEYKSQ